jgi:hypothetical protein
MLRLVNPILRPTQRSPRARRSLTISAATSYAAF